MPGATVRPSWSSSVRLAARLGLAALDLGQLLAGRELAELDGDGLLLLAAQDAHVDLGVGREAGDLAGEVAAVGDLVAVDGQDGVAVLEAGLGRGPGVGDLADERTLGLAEAQARRRVLVDVLDLDAEPAAADGAARLELRDDLVAVLAGTAKAMPTLPPDGL